MNKRMKKRMLYAELQNILDLAGDKLSDLASLGLDKAEDEFLSKAFKQVFHAQENVDKSKKKAGL